MAVSVVMPALEMAQETGKLVSWLKKEGEPVKKGDMLLEVETDKAVVEIEAQTDGVLGGVTAKVGDVVPVGQTIAWLLKPGESVPQQSAPTQTGRTGRRRTLVCRWRAHLAESAQARPRARRRHREDQRIGTWR
jgi:pyruvate/2-oxoglutarate dehydrogenase complex dihydrolipoamide acyltransferase (E2) component